MKAITYTRYGGPEVLEISDLPRPEAGPGEILVRVHASSVTTGDWRLRAAAFPGILWLPGRLMTGLFRPKSTRLGGDFSGVVEAVGDGVTRFAPGDAVFGTGATGAHAEYVTVAEDGAVAAKPGALGHEEAASLPFGGATALAFLRDRGRLAAGERVLITGASGGVGVYAVQIARALGAEVTAMASARNHDMLRALGADHVVDYREVPVEQAGTGFDMVFDGAGFVTLRQARKVLSPAGRFVTLHGTAGVILRTMLTPSRVVFGVSFADRAQIEDLAAMAASGRISPVIDAVYPLGAVREAHAHVEARHRKGAVILRIRGAAPARLNAA